MNASGHRLAPALLLAPFLALFAAFLILPLGGALVLSLYRNTLAGGVRFVGLANHARVLTDGDFWNGVGHMAMFGLVQVPVMLGLALAIVLDRGTAWLRGAFRIAFFVPYAVPSVVAALIWGYLYGPSFGPITQISRALGLDTPDLLSRHWMLASIGNVVTWEYVGYNMVILYSALQALPAELSEAARGLGLDVDVVRPGDPLDAYRLVLAPVLPIVDAATLAALAATDAVTVFGPRSFSKTADGAIPSDLPPGPLAALLGIRVAEVASLPPGLVAPVEGAVTGAAERWREWVETTPVTEATQTLARFADGEPAMVRAGNRFYVAFWPDAAARDGIVRLAVARAELPVHVLPRGVRLRRRGDLRS